MKTRFQQVAVFSRGIAKIPHLEALLGAQRVILSPKEEDAARLDAVVGWGNKANTYEARDYARRNGVPYLRAEDGFIRSIGVGASGDPPLSILLDASGIYYDAGAPSDLENLLNAERGDLDSPELLARARQAIASIVEAGLSKYNDAAPGALSLGPATQRKRVLVVDQTRGDLSIRCGRATSETFRKMFDAACVENPGAEILVKVHPDVLAGAKHGHLADVSGQDVRIIARASSPIELLQQVDSVYAVTSQMGFEALLVGKPVTLFGAPFYAGWGVTDDRAPVDRRQRKRSVAEIFAAAYIVYPNYVVPDTGEPGEIEDVIAHLAEQRRQFERNRGRIFCFGFRPWKRGYVRQYLRCPGNQIVFSRDADHAIRQGFGEDCHVLTWGQRGIQHARELGTRFGAAHWRMEDGFLRSVGLGSDLTTPASLVVDKLGIYYDPTVPSELEDILANAQFNESELNRASELRSRIVATGVSKYNVGTQGKLRVPAAKKIVLVPGQVEDDASIQLGCRDIATNLELLRAARKSAGADAHIIFKPHPDVLSGNRRGAVDSAAASEVCDHIETDASLADCLAVADEVHTMTSLVGFESLLRGLKVYTYGQPFYSGWGLTADRHPHERRKRRLSIDELVAGTLLRYPRYLNSETGRFTGPEYTLESLRRERDANPNAGKLRISWLRRQVRKLVHAARGVLDAA